MRCPFNNDIYVHYHLSWRGCGFWYFDSIIINKYRISYMKYEWHGHSRYCNGKKGLLDHSSSGQSPKFLALHELHHTVTNSQLSSCQYHFDIVYLRSFNVTSSSSQWGSINLVTWHIDTSTTLTMWFFKEEPSWRKASIKHTKWLNFELHYHYSHTNLFLSVCSDTLSA